MVKLLLIFGLFLNLCAFSCAQSPIEQHLVQAAEQHSVILSLGQIGANQSFSSFEERPSEIVDFEAFVALAAEVQTYRKNRLVNLDSFLALAKRPNTVILDTRSQQFYQFKHIKGAKNLTFADFTIQNLARVIPSYETTILIYCNNNFRADEFNFPSKIAPSFEILNDLGIKTGKKPISLALNIPTFINLYGYGYRNVYELESLVHVLDPRLEFEGTAVKPPLEEN